MNAEEGEAAEAFSFGSDEAFVDFLLRAVLDPEEPQALADLVAGYAEKIAQRADLAAERDFVEGTLERLEPLQAAERAAGGARVAEAAAQRPPPRWPRRSSRGRPTEDERLAAAVALVDAARAAEAVAAQDERRLREIAAELRRLVAELTLAEAERAEAAATEARDTAQARVAAWQAVEPVLAHQLATAEAQRLRRVVDAEQERARPALRARQAAAVALAAGLRAGIVDAESAAEEAAGEAAAAHARAAAAHDRELAQAKEAAGHAASAEAARSALPTSGADGGNRPGAWFPRTTGVNADGARRGPGQTAAAAALSGRSAVAMLRTAGWTAGGRSSSASRPRPSAPRPTPAPRRRPSRRRPRS